MKYPRHVCIGAIFWKLSFSALLCALILGLWGCTAPEGTESHPRSGGILVDVTRTNETGVVTETVPNPDVVSGIEAGRHGAEFFGAPVGGIAGAVSGALNLGLLWWARIVNARRKEEKINGVKIAGQLVNDIDKLLELARDAGIDTEKIDDWKQRLKENQHAQGVWSEIQRILKRHGHA